MAKHALYGEMRLAGIGGAEHGSDAAVAILIIVGEEITHIDDLGFLTLKNCKSARYSALQRYEQMIALTKRTIPERS
jgi:hypothetical protein